MGSVGRIFVAVGMADADRHGLAAYLVDVLEQLPGKPVPPPNWHVTLRYLGDMTDIAYDRFVHALDEVAKPAPFRLAFAGLGAFPKPTNGSVLWLGIGRGEAELVGLAEACEGAGLLVGLGPDDRPYLPHLTLARVQPPQNLWPWLAAVPEPPINVDVTEVGVYRSHLGGSSAEYELLDTLKL